MEKTNPIYTVITCVYNAEKWIDETIKSVLKFTNRLETEYIVIDDGSTDNSWAEIQRYIPEIWAIHQENMGEAASINYGLKIARGEYVLVVSADDPMCSSTLLSDSKAIMDAERKVVCVYPNWNQIDLHGDVLQTMEVPEFSMDKLLGEGNCIIGPGAVFRKSSALSIGGRNSKLKYTNDYDFWLRLSKVGAFKKLDSLGANWRTHPESTSVKERGLGLVQERIHVVEDFLQNNLVDKRMAKKALFSTYSSCAKLSIFDDNVPARRLLLKSLRISPIRFIKLNPAKTMYMLAMPYSVKVHQYLKRRKGGFVE